MAYDLIIFDLDGTLLDTAPDVHRCVNDTLKKMSLPTIDLQQTRAAIGPGPDNFAKLTLGKLAEKRFEEFLALFRPLYFRESVTLTRPFSNIEPLLSELTRVKKAVASNKSLRFSLHILDALSMTTYFDLVVGPELVEKPKPAADMIEYVLDAMHVEKNKAIIVGDTDNDLVSGKAAGIDTCAALWGYGDERIFHELNPNYIIKDPLELLQIISH
jgi:phosphoglycolate phosphatase